MIQLNKNSFLKLLESNLKHMSEKEKVDIIEEYYMHFADGSNENKSKEEISKELEEPEKIAIELNAVYSIDKVEENKSIKEMFTPLLSIMR